MKVGDRIHVPIEFHYGLATGFKTGKVLYINEKRRWVTVELQGKLGPWKSSYWLSEVREAWGLNMAVAHHEL